MPQDKRFVPDEDNRFIPDESISTPTPPRYGQANLSDLISGNLPKPEPSFLSSVWHGISDPLTTAPSQFMKSIANYVDIPREEDWKIPFSGGATWKGLGAGMLEGIGDVASGLTSPLNIATAGLGGLEFAGIKAGLPQVAKLANIGGRVAGAPVVAHGASTLLDPESTLGERGMGLTEMAGGGAAMLHTPTKSRVAEGLDITDPNIGVKLADASKMNPAQLAELNKFLDSVPDINPAEAQAAINAPPTQIEPMPTGFFDRMAPEPVSKPTTPIGQTVIIKAEKATPELVKQAREQGFEFQGLNDQGHFRFKKTAEGIEQPILESEVGQARPTSAGERQQLGPAMDVKRSSALTEALNFPRGVMASWDLSAPLRQGLPLIHRKEWWKSWNQMFKAWGSEVAFDQIQRSIADRPLFKQRTGPGDKVLPSFAEDAGLKLTDLTDLTKREEAVMSTWAEKVPGVRRSNRAYTAFLNKLRADTFENLIKQGKVIGANGETNIPLARELANFVNTATGRGSLGKLESSAVALNSMFFSPRLIASRLKMLDPRLYLMGDPIVRKEALKSLFAVAAAGNIVGQLGRLAGGTVESDPTSSDFGKLKVGNIRLDPYGGFQQYVVLANRLMQGRMKSSTSGREYNLGEEFGRPTRLDVIGRFAESKLHPALSFATGFLRGKDFTGQSFNIPEELASRFIPIFLQDLKQLLTESPDIISLPEDIHMENLPLAIPSAFGMSVQQY